MKKLNYEVLKNSGYDGYILKEAPEKECSLEKEISFVHLLIIGLILPMKKQDGMENVV